MDTITGEGITLGNVLLVPPYSGVIPSQVNLTTSLIKKIKLNVPLMSTGMNTITEHHATIVIARQSGIDVIHKNMSVNDQTEEVDRVKRSENDVITNLLYLSSGHTLRGANDLTTKFRISGISITGGKEPVGTITSRDLKFEEDFDRPTRECITTRSPITAKEGITLKEAKTVLAKIRVGRLLVMDDDSNSEGLTIIEDIKKQVKYPLSTKDEQRRLLCGATVNITVNVLERVEALVKAEVDVIVLDSVYGNSTSVIRCARIIKDAFVGPQIVVGNVATAEATKNLIEADTGCVKVGVGPDSIYTTRVVADIGTPQVTVVINRYKMAEEYDVPIITNEGIKYSGDMVKVIVADGSACMMGGIFAGCDKSPETSELYQGRKHKVCHGVGSIAVMKNRSKDRYFQSDAEKLVPEGVKGRVTYRRLVEDTIFQLLSGLRSGVGYCSVSDISTLQETTRFMGISAASLRESHPHDIHITKEAPSYSIEE